MTDAILKFLEATREGYQRTYDIVPKERDFLKTLRKVRVETIDELIALRTRELST